MAPKPQKVAVITGASSGLGKASALHFAAKGWRVGLIARGIEGLEATRSEIMAIGGIAEIAVADVGDAEAMERAADSIETDLGAINVWINVAGTGTYSFFDEGRREDFEQVIRTNLIGSINGTRAALKRMMPRNNGTIVQIASAISYRGIPLQSAYATSKWGLRGFHEAVRAELLHKKSNVQLTLVNPPGLNTPFFAHAGSDIKGFSPHVPAPVYQPEVVADAIYHAANGRRREWNVSTTSIVLMLADRLIPKTPMDWIVGKFGVRPQLTKRADVAAQRDPTLYGPSTKAPAVRGPFGSMARNWSLGWTASKHPIAATLLVAAVVYSVHRLAKRHGS